MIRPSMQKKTKKNREGIVSPPCGWPSLVTSLEATNGDDPERCCTRLYLVFQRSLCSEVKAGWKTEIYEAVTEVIMITYKKEKVQHLLLITLYDI